MRKADNSVLPPEFFERIPTVKKRLIANGGEVPRWPWVWFLNGAALLLVTMWGLASFCPEHAVRRLSWLLIVAAWMCAFGVLTLHQWAVLRAWFSKRGKRK